MHIKDLSETTIGCLVWIVVILGFYGGCEWYDSYTEKRKMQAIRAKEYNDSIRKAFIEDSLANDPVYQDSIKKRAEAYKIWKNEDDSIREMEIVGFVLRGDSEYHNHIHSFRYTNDHSYGFLMSDIHNIRLLTYKDVENSSYTLCSECSEIEDVFCRYNNGELFTEDDAKEHDLIPIDEIDEYRGLLEEDEDDRW